MKNDRFDRPTVIRRGRPEDMEAIIDFGDAVFSRSHRPHDFAKILPKLYGPGVDSSKDHLLVTPEDGEDIHALIYSGTRTFRPSATWANASQKPEHGADELRVNGIGTVSVHHRERSKRYMRELMHTAIEDMMTEGVTLSLLGGQRQRYAYYGYEPAGSDVYINVSQENYSKAFGRDYLKDDQKGSVVSYPELGDTEAEAGVFAIYEASHPWITRTADNWYLIATSWLGREVYVYRKEAEVKGYLIADKEGSNRNITEIGIANPDDVLDMVGTFLAAFDVSGARLQIPAWQAELAARFLRIAEGYSTGSAIQTLVLDWTKMVSATMQMKQALSGLKDDEIVLTITECPAGEREQRLHLQVKEGIPAVSEITDSGIPAHVSEIKLPYSLAVRALWSPVFSELTYELSADDRHTLHRTGWFPLPFSFLPPDRV